jgi:NAD(P)-dependent dehydrogenase (short-subunit alcohol dehydrogenase family)
MTALFVCRFCVLASGARICDATSFREDRMGTRKTAIVTGAGTGIGRSVATALAKAGWNTVFCGRRKTLLDQAVAAAGAGEATALAIACDITKPKEVEALFAATVEAFGRVDLLFNNAGMGYKSTPIDEIPVEVWNDVLAVNLTGSFLCARAAFGQMRRQTPQGGRIINNGSVSAHAPRPGSVPYTATKHAITGLTRTLALDGRPFDIACGQIDIGNALTEMAMPMTVGVPQANGTTAAEAVMDVQHVADAVVHMADLPLDANVLFMTVMATKMPFVGRG